MQVDWIAILAGLPMATFLGVQAIMIRRMLDTFSKKEVEDRLNKLEISIDKRFEKHDEALSKNTAALIEVGRSLAVLTTKMESRDG